MKLVRVPAREFSARFRGWKLPRELSEDVGPDQRGVNPFTKQETFFAGRRRAVGPAPIADGDAVYRPTVDDLPAIELHDDIYTQTLDTLAMVVCGWTAQYAAGEIAGRYVEGGEGRNDWFELVPHRVVEAIAVLPGDSLLRVAAEWSKACADMSVHVASASLPSIHSFCRQVDGNSLVFVWGTR